MNVKAGEKIGKISRPIPPPKSLPDPGETALEFEQERPTAEPDWNAPQRDRQDASYAQLAGPNGDFAVPTVEELGIKKPSTSHRGGETVALAMLDAIIADKKYTATFEKPKTAPTAFSPAATTVLSPHLHFGSISCRTFYWAVQDVVDRYPAGRASTPPTSLTGQLLFRDMYFGAQASLGYRFGQTVGNSHCRFIPWHLPSTIDDKTGLATGDYAVDTPLADTWFRRWKFGRTGFPWIDALMRQLRREGWIHHLGRHAVASFLTRGGCYIDWMRGADVFEEWLIDHEVACNVGNWQWLSCTAFFAQFFRVYSPVAFPAKWDKEGAFVRKYVPELAKYPAKYIYEPWKCPIKDQKAAGCVIRDYEEEKEPDDEKDVLGSMWDDGAAVPSTYPKPMFDFATRRSICLEGMKKAYQVGLYGNDPRVLDGTWRGLFPDDAEGPTEGNNSLDAHFAVHRQHPDANEHDDEGGEEANHNEEDEDFGSKKLKNTKRIQDVDKDESSRKRAGRGEDMQGIEEDEGAAADPGVGADTDTGTGPGPGPGTDTTMTTTTKSPRKGKTKNTGETQTRKRVAEHEMDRDHPTDDLIEKDDDNDEEGKQKKKRRRTKRTLSGQTHEEGDEGDETGHGIAKSGTTMTRRSARIKHGSANGNGNDNGNGTGNGTERGGSKSKSKSKQATLDSILTTSAPAPAPLSKKTQPKRRR